MSSGDFTAKLSLPYLLPNQAQKHVTVNENLRRLDTLVMTAIERQGENIPPQTPAEGQAWLLGDAPGGAWEGMPQKLAFWADGAWHFEQPHQGWRVYDKELQSLIIFDGSTWLSVGADMQDLTFIGLATLADEQNPFAARLNAAFFTARETTDGGTGDLRLTINKQDADYVGSLLFQSGWSGRAELGLIGNDDVSIRSSADGLNWKDSLRIDAGSGHIGILGAPTSHDALTVNGRFRASSNEGYFLLRDNGILDMARHSGGAVYLRARSAGSTMNFGVTDSSENLTNNALSLRPDQADALFAYTPSPISDGEVDLGQAGRAWRDLYLQNAPTVSSDRRGKLDIDDLPDCLRLIEFLRPVSYRRGEAEARHFGFIAQEVREALIATGNADAALWKLSDEADENSAQMLSLEELIPVLVSALQRLIVRIERLERV